MSAVITALYMSEAPAIRRYFRLALNGDVEAAEDLAAESFTQLVQALGRGKVDNPEALLRTITKRQLVGEIRRRVHNEDTPAGLLGLEEDNHHLELIVPAEMTYETAEFRAKFDRAVRQLGDDARDAFILITLRGLSTHAAADVLGVAQETARRWHEIATGYVRSALLAG